MGDALDRIHPRKENAMSIQQAAVRVEESDSAVITATIVPDERRLAFLPKHFGEKHIMRAEMMVYGQMQRLTRNEYQGGYWHYVELSNGGSYMRLNSEKRFRISVEGNYFDDEMSADAASIVACLFAINQLIWQGLDHLEDAYYQLRDYAREHAESALICAAID
jgi:gamma-glutamylcyclotransferase (GGCT)/AIG2-like uncharacterized protein YtfP